jgi:CorA-like Mg2+ transporter protein
MPSRSSTSSALQSYDSTAAGEAVSQFIPLVRWNTDPADTVEVIWECSKVIVVISEGSGQIVSPFMMETRTFKERCEQLQFSTRILQKLKDRASMIEHAFHFPSQVNPLPTSSEPAKVPTHLEIALATYETDGFWMVLRYDMRSKAVSCMMFVKTKNFVRNGHLRARDVHGYLEKHTERIKSHPFLVVSVILERMQSRIQDYRYWRERLYDMEARLGITRNLEVLKKGKYTAISHNFEGLNADFGELARRAADNKLIAATLLEQTKLIHRLAEISEKLESPPGPPISQNCEELQSIISSAELYVKHMEMVQAVIESQANMLYNRITKQDSESMKTIAVVALLFLPATFVSAVFASGIFNFQAGEPEDNARTISRYGWIYLLVCVVVTVCTLIFWAAWYFWGRKKLERWKFSRIQNRHKDAQGSRLANFRV